MSVPGDMAGDVLIVTSALGPGVALAIDADDLDRGIGRGREHVPIVQEGVLRVADVDEGGLEAGIEVLDPALEDAADHPVVGFALDLEFLQPAVDQEGDPLFQRLVIVDQLAVGSLFLAKDG